MLRSRILRAARWVVSPAGGLSLASKFCDRPRLIVCCGSLRVVKFRRVGSGAYAKTESTVDPGA